LASLSIIKKLGQVLYEKTAKVINQNFLRYWLTTLPDTSHQSNLRLPRYTSAPFVVNNVLYFYCSKKSKKSQLTSCKKATLSARYGTGLFLFQSAKRRSPKNLSCTSLSFFNRLVPLLRLLPLVNILPGNFLWITWSFILQTISTSSFSFLKLSTGHLSGIFSLKPYFIPSYQRLELIAQKRYTFFKIPWYNCIGSNL
jgi:hypothetical protein